MIKNANTVHKDSLKFSERIAKSITAKVGTMICAIIFGILAFISLPSAIKSGDMLVIVGWVAQTFLQLVLLPIIMVGQNLQSRHSEHIAEATYESDLHIHKQVDYIVELLTKNHEY